MSRSISVFAALLMSAPALALGQAYLPAPAPVPPGTPAARPTLVQIFNWLDTNHDGYLELDEFLAAPWVTNRAKATRFFYWMDTDKDGLVSLQEFLAAYRIYSGPDGYTVRVTYPFAWCYWRPWQYGWYWHARGWRAAGHPGYPLAGRGSAGGWWHGPRTTGGYAVAARGGAAHGTVAQVNRPAKNIAHARPAHAVKIKHPATPKHPAKHVKPHKAKRAAHAKAHAKAHGHGGSHAGHHR